jgi:hypothetical protein
MKAAQKIDFVAIQRKPILVDISVTERTPLGSIDYALIYKLRIHLYAALGCRVTNCPLKNRNSVQFGALTTNIIISPDIYWPG